MSSSVSVVRLALEGVRWSTGVWLLWRVPRCGEAASDGSLDDVAVVVPARDEEDTLPRLLASLATGAPGEVVVVDDHSSDATAEVARAGGATVVGASPLPGGWTGKAWACWTGAGATTRPVLVFLDADTVLEPGGLRRVVGEQRRRGGLVSVQPFHEARRPYERLSSFFNVVSMMGVGAFTPLAGRLRPAGAFGPCLACRRHDYDRVGGHRAVAGQVVEDVALARHFAAAGLPVACLGGRGSVRFRMYPGGVRQLVEGWSKNFATGARASRPEALALSVAWVSGCLSAAGYAASAAAGRGSDSLPPRAALGLYAAYAAQIGWMLRRVGRFGWWPAAVYPVPLAFFVAVFARSLFLTHVRREVRWRGRAVPVGAARPSTGG